MTKGKLEVRVLSATGLDNMDLLKKMDPYVIVTCGKQEQKTSVQTGKGTEPEWNEKLVFNISEDIKELKVKIMDKDRHSDDDFVGQAIILLWPVFTNGNIEDYTYNVIKDDKYCGYIHIGLIFTPDTEQLVVHKGTLEVLILSATGLADTDFLSKVDPYVTITCGTQEQKSNVLSDKGSEPEWNEKFVFTISEDVKEITVKVMDKDRRGEDDILGETLILLWPVFGYGSIEDHVYNLTKDDKYCGYMHIGLTFTPAEGGCAGAEAEAEAEADADAEAEAEAEAEAVAEGSCAESMDVHKC